MSKFKDITGEKFDKLTVIQKAGTNKNHMSVWLCKCECGNITTATTNELNRKHKRSCGCLRTQYYNSKATRTHGESYSKLYHVWASIKSRCSNTNDDNYKHYGSRGITYCSEWSSFEPFYKWANNNGYKEGLTIDRIDVNGNYEPSNCRWITHKEQQNNRRNTHLISYNNVTKSIAGWAEFFKIHPSTINSYVKLHDITYEEYIELRINGGIKNARKM